MAFAPNGGPLVTGDEAGAVVRWDGKLNPKLLYEPSTTQSHQGITAIAVSPDGQFAAAATSTTVRLVNIATPSDPVEVQVQHPVEALAFSSPTTLLIGCMDGGLSDQLLAVDIRSPKTIRTVLSVPSRSILQKGVTALAVSADGKTVVSGAMSGDVIIWNAADLTQRNKFSAAYPVVGVSTDGTNAVATTVPGLGIGPFERSVGNARIQLWKLSDGTAVSAEIAGAFLTAMTATDSALGTLAVRDLDGSVTTWSDLAGELLRQSGTVSDIVPDPQSAESIITVGLDGRIDFINARTARITRSASATGHGSVMALAASGSLLVTGHSDGTILVRDRDTGQPVGTAMVGHEGPVFRLAVHGDMLASGGKDGTVRLWDMKSHSQLRSWTAGGNLIIQVAFDPSGRRLYVADSIVRLAADRGRMWWVSPTSGEINGLREDETTARAILVSADRILAGFGDGELRWLDTDLRLLPESIPFRHRSNVNAVAGRGDLVVTAGADGVAAVLHVPDMTSMLQLPRLDIADRALYSSAITGDRKYAVVGSEDGRIQIVNLDTNDLIVRGCGIVGRPATTADLGQPTKEVEPPCH
ncbi:WD40 repeat domain-containing protein [Amycolatopsis sp. cmx-4-68]|uniref:WD40 repeat domain-containing protein n=1 Tax=Amycolatopsis sp. cmx-4-68 TaxID=2790938 RepID=UPI00397D90A6